MTVFTLKTEYFICIIEIFYKCQIYNIINIIVWNGNQMLYYIIVYSDGQFS